MTYSPPYIYTGLYEEESKAFEIVGRWHEPLWLKLKDDFRQDRLDRGATGAQLSAIQESMLHASLYHLNATKMCVNWQVCVLATGQIKQIRALHSYGPYNSQTFLEASDGVRYGQSEVKFYYPERGDGSGLLG